MNSNEIYIMKEIYISKSDAASNYGFCIKGGRKKPLGIYVTDVVKNSAADLAGLAKNDTLVRVNNIDFNNLTIDQAIDYLKTSDRIDILLKRHLSSNIRVVELNRNDLKQTFGFLVDNIQCGVIYLNRIFIKTVYENSIAFYGGLKQDDEILQINGKFIKDSNYDEIYQLFKMSYSLKMLINSNSLYNTVSKTREDSIDKMIKDLSDIEVSHHNNNNNINRDKSKKTASNSRKSSQLYNKIQRNRNSSTKSRQKDQNDKSIKIEYLINSLDDDEDDSLESTEISFNFESNNQNKEKLFLPLTAEIFYNPQQILNIETELIIPESPVRQKLIEDYEYVEEKSNREKSNIFETKKNLNYSLHKSKVISNHKSSSDDDLTKSDGLVSIRLFKEPEWPKIFGLKFDLIWDEIKQRKKFLINRYESQSLAEKLKLFQIGSEIRKVNENDLSMFDNITDAEYMLENVYTFNRQITLLVKPIN